MLDTEGRRIIALTDSNGVEINFEHFGTIKKYGLTFEIVGKEVTKCDSSLSGYKEDENMVDVTVMISSVDSDGIKKLTACNDEKVSREVYSEWVSIAGNSANAPQL